MWILIVSSLIVMKMSEVLCWPSMSIISAIFTRKDLFLNFEEFAKTDIPEYLLIYFKNYYSIEHVNVILRTAVSEF